MKIDVHTHTKKCKSGDAPTREISADKFCETILATDVRIIAITNHNVFDLDQYTAIITRLAEDVQVWPGIELDVQHNGSRGHLLIIVSPGHAKSLSEAVGELTAGSTPDNFVATVEDVLSRFDAMNPVYIAHYKKSPSLSDEALEQLGRGTRNPACVIKEVTNAISAGVYISHGHASIYGSDVHDWDEYQQPACQLPDLRLDVDSFEHFCLLLKKDLATINTLLDRKTSEELVLLPFEDSSILKIKAFNDIHVIFGPKGTGKSCILKAIEKHYSDNGVDAKVYQPASDRLDEMFDTKGEDLTINLDSYAVNSCSDEIEFLRRASEVAITALSRFIAHFAAKTTNRNAKQILLRDIEPEEESAAKRAFFDVRDAAARTAAFLQFLATNDAAKKELEVDEFAAVTRILSQLRDRLRNREWTTFSTWKEICLLNAAVETFRNEVARKTGAPPKPTTTGFRDYAMNRLHVWVNVDRIIKSVDTQIPTHLEPVGSLGSDKGVLQCQTEFVFQNGRITDGALSTLTGLKKAPQKKFVNFVRKILQHAYADDLFQHISDLNDVEDVENIRTVHDLLLFKRYFALGGQPYTPSSGEASMVMLQRELETDKEVYILDEPERSLGNEYINDVIVPLIKDRARAGKKVFISTHDANIAVRTLPYSSVYRCHGKAGYRTYLGNPFGSKLVNPDDATDQLDWKKISMKTLEGGEEAFGERGIIYGND